MFYLVHPSGPTLKIKAPISPRVFGSMDNKRRSDECCSRKFPVLSRVILHKTKPSSPHRQPTSNDQTILGLYKESTPLPHDRATMRGRSLSLTIPSKGEPPLWSPLVPSLQTTSITLLWGSRAISEDLRDMRSFLCSLGLFENMS